jgi:hypothetical protein
VTGTVKLAPTETVPDPTVTVAGCANSILEVAHSSSSAAISNLINDLVSNMSLFIMPCIGVSTTWGERNIRIIAEEVRLVFVV